MRCNKLIERLKRALTNAIETAVSQGNEYTVVLMQQRKENYLWEISLLFNSFDDSLLVEVYHIDNLERESPNVEKYLKQQLEAFVKEAWGDVDIDNFINSNLDVAFADWNDYTNYKYG